MWREGLESLNGRLDAGAATKKADFYRVLHSIAGGLEAQDGEAVSLHDVTERYACAKALCERMYVAFPGERSSNGVVTLLARLAAPAGDPDTAVALLGGAKKLRLSMFVPVLRAYASTGSSDAAERLYADKLVRLRDEDKSNPNDDESHHHLWENVLAPRLDAWRVAVERGAWPAEDERVSRLQSILNDVIGIRSWITEGSLLEEALRAAFGALGWRVAVGKPDDRGCCPHSGEQLQTILSDEELAKVAADIDDLVRTDLESNERNPTKRKTARPVTKEMLTEAAAAWAKFKETVMSTEELYDSVFDGANIGQQMQNFGAGCFQHRAIEALMRTQQAVGRRSAVVLHRRWTVIYDETGEAQDRPPLKKRQRREEKPASGDGDAATPCATDAGGLLDATPTKERRKERPEMPLATQWRESGQLVFAPSGINDDHFAMYLAVTMCRRGKRDVQLVTNDFLRDHVRRARSSRPMRLFLDRHVARYTLKYVPPEDIETYTTEQAEADASNGATTVPEDLVTPGPHAGPNTLQKLRFFPPLGYVALAQASPSGRCWHFPLGKDWICPREPSKRPDVEAAEQGAAVVDSIGDACLRYERSHPSFLVCWDPKRPPVAHEGAGATSVQHADLTEPEQA